MVKGKVHMSLTAIRRERGVALFISLVLLLVLTIVGVSAVQTTTLETRMARNEHDTLLAFQAAESALRDAEAFLLANVASVEDTDAFTPAGAAGLWDVADPGDPDPWDLANIWTGGQSVVAPTESGSPRPAEPTFFVRVTVMSGTSSRKVSVRKVSLSKAILKSPAFRPGLSK